MTGTSQILPLGVPGGITSGFSDIPDGAGMIRLGGETIVMDGETYRIWAATERVPDRAGLLELALSAGWIDAAARLDSLTSAGLVVGAGEPLAAIADRLKIHMTGTCLGNGSDRSSRFAVAGRDSSAIYVDARIFQVLLQNSEATKITDLCAAIDLAGLVDDPAPSLSVFLTSCPTLVRGAIIRLDLVPS